MNRKILAVLGACLAFALVSSSCGSDSDEGASSSTAAAPVTTAAPATTAAPVASGSADDGLAGTSVTVFGPESSDEEAGALQDALDVFAAESGIEITYTGNRDAADMINTQVAGGNPPDIFVFPQPGKLADFARDGSVLPLPADVSSSMEWSDAWTSFGNVDGTQYGVPTKSDLKSLVWYKPAKFAEKGYEIPGTWDALKSLAGDMIANGDTPFCVGIESGPATGWTFTDWVEDLMLRMHGADLYDEWVAGTLPFSSPEVSGVFEEVLALWNTPGMVYASGGSIAATPFGDNGQPLVDDDCMMHRQASFYAAFIPEGTAFADGSPDAIDTFYFPSVKGDYPVLGAGTLVGAFRDAPEVWEVMKYFGSASYAESRQAAQTERKGGGLSGFLSGALNQDPSVYQPLEQSFLNILVSADVVRFDASDLMPAAVGAGTFWTDGTAVVNGDKTVAEATADIDASWPGAAPVAADVTGLAAVCPSPLVFQTDWFPESEHGALYEMIGAGYTIDADNMVVTGPGQIGGAPLGIDIEVRTGGPAIGWSPVASYMYTDDSIHIGYANTEAQAQLVDTPLISVMAPLEKNPQMIMWDPNTYPDVNSIADLGAQGVTINVFAGGVFIEVWIAEGVVDAANIDPSYDGGPAMFIAADGAIAQQGFASAEPYQYLNEFSDWGKQVEYQLLHDTGFEVYSQTLGVRPDDMEDMRACLELFVPVVQQSVVNFSSNPARANAIIVDAVDTFGSFWVYSMELGEYSVATMNELGLHGNGPDSTVGNMEESRIQGVIDKMVAAGMEVTTTNASDLFTNEFIDMSIGFAEPEPVPEPEPVAGFDGNTIKIGVVNDFSGPAAIIGLPLQSGVATYYEWVNAQGGIAGKYPVELIDADSTYNPSVAVQAYNDMKDDIALIGNLFGTPVVTALLESLNEDGLMAVPASLESGWVRESNLMPWGAPYQIQVINGIDWWLNEGGGSTDQVYCSLIQDDPYGEAGQAGLEWIAPKVGITITEVARYVPGDADFSAQIGQLQGSGCEVVWLTALPSAVGGIGGAAVGAGFAPTWIGQSPVWINAFAASALAPYLEANLIIVGEGSTWGDTSMPGAVAMMERMATYAPEQAPDYYFAAGYVMGMAGAGILEQAVANGDLSREGILQASTQASIDFEGLSGDYHYGPVDERQPSISNTIFRVNPEVPNGVEAVEVGYESAYASDYDF